LASIVTHVAITTVTSRLCVCVCVCVCVCNVYVFALCGEPFLRKPEKKKIRFQLHVKQGLHMTGTHKN